MKIKVIFHNKDFLIADKPPRTITFRENQTEGVFLIEELIKDFPEIKKAGEFPRHGCVHRLDKDTSGLVLIALNNESFSFFQNEFKQRRVNKEYLALCINPFKEKEGLIETNIGRSPRDRRRQKAFPLYDAKNPRLAVTKYKLLKNLSNYALIRAVPETGRKHQIRCHLAYIKHPIAGDTVYGFKNQSCPENLERHFLHAEKLGINTLRDNYQEFSSELAEDLKQVLTKIENEKC